MAKLKEFCVLNNLEVAKGARKAQLVAKVAAYCLNE